MTAGASYRRLWLFPVVVDEDFVRVGARLDQNLCDLPEVPLHRPHQARCFVLVRSEDFRLGLQQQLHHLQIPPDRRDMERGYHES